MLTEGDKCNVSRRRVHGQSRAGAAAACRDTVRRSAGATFAPPTGRTLDETSPSWPQSRRLRQGAELVVEQRAANSSVFEAPGPRRAWRAAATRRHARALHCPELLPRPAFFPPAQRSLPLHHQQQRRHSSLHSHPDPLPTAHHGCSESRTRPMPARPHADLRCSPSPPSPRAKSSAASTSSPLTRTSAASVSSPTPSSPRLRRKALSARRRPARLLLSYCRWLRMARLLAAPS